MKSLGREVLKVTDIIIGDRLRQIDEAHAELLAVSLQETGRLRQPPEVRRQKKGAKVIHTLIAGGHRMRAVEIVGWPVVEVEVYEGSDDETRLWEIDENLIRHELNPLDRAVFLAEREAVYLRLHPEAAHGGDRKSAEFKRKNQVAIMAARSFAEDVREKTGLSDRTIQRAVFIASKLAPDVRAALPGTELAKKQSELVALAQLGHGEQRQALALLLNAEAKVKNVAAAVKLMKGVRAPGPAADEGFKALLSKWTRATPRERQMLLEHLWLHKTDDTLRAFVAGLEQEEAA
ncbi:MAG TPA: ParB N-terminal domain-containing protein [Azospirillum sp.]|nr:ParB N-terminal domain-containing protein [Azospirillum sp.]